MSEPKLHVQMINTQYRLGGAETVMHQIAGGLREAGHDCRFVLSTLGKHRPRTANVRVLYPALLDRLRYTRFARVVERLWPAAPAQRRAFRRVVRAGRGLFHLHSFTGYAAIDDLARLARRAPVLWTLHCYWGDSRHVDARGTPYEAAWGLAPQLLRAPRTVPELEALDRELQPLYDAPLWVAVPSRAAFEAASRLPQLGKWRIRHIPNGVEPNVAAAKSTLKKPVILVVNRDYRIADKGFPIVREALECLPENCGWQIVLVGGHAKWAAQQLPPHLETRAHDFLADRAELAALYATAEIFLFASERENFPCVTLEAMAAECCVVATPTDGVTEQFTDGEHGLLAEEVGGPALGCVLAKAVADSALRHRLASAARQRVHAHYSEAVMRSRYLELYREMHDAQSCGVKQ